MDKVESMQHDACLPDKWWNFAVEHAVRLYNRTFMERLKKSPFEAMHGSAPDLSNLKIFGCGAYVFLPSEIRKNKLAPKSEMMIHLGIEDGIKGYCFMCLPNNILFYSAKALFNEDYFLKCRTQIPKAITCLPESSKRVTRSSSTPPAPPTFYYPPNNLQDWPQPTYPPAGMPPPAPPLQAPGPLRGRPTLLHTPRGPPPLPMRLQPGQTGFTPPVYIPPSQPTCAHAQWRPPPSPSLPRGPLSPSDTAGPSRMQTRSRARTQTVPPSQPDSRASSPAPRRSSRIRSQTTLPRNVYGDRPPLEIQRDTQHSPTWRRLIRFGQPATQAGPSTQMERPPSSPDSGEDSEREIDRSLAYLAKHGGVVNLNALLATVEPPASEIPDLLNVRQWTFKQIQNLSHSEKEGWIEACKAELSSLRSRQVYDLVDAPKGRNIINNRWVFDVKTDGQKRARLVAKGFSQAEGIDYTDIFSPVV